MIIYDAAPSEENAALNKMLLNISIVRGMMASEH